jgi:tetratricopeptide (TPR) repeat protein
VCDVLKEMCYDRGAKDNLTAIMVKLDTSPRRTGRSTEEAVDASTPPEVEQKSRIARIQVELMDREAAEHEELKPVENTPSAGAQTFSSQLARNESFPVSPSSPWRRVLIPLLLALALVVGAFTGLYVQRVLSPTSPDTQTDQELTPAQHAFEEGRRAFEAGQYTAARDVFARAVSLNPKVAAYYHWLAETQVILKEYHAGAENFWKAASLSGVADDYLHAAMAYYAAGEKEKAAEALAASLNAKH